MKSEHRHVRKGEIFLKGVSRDEIKQKYRKEPAGKSHERLTAALLRRDRHSLEEIGRNLGRS